MENRSENKPNIAVTRQDMATLRLSQLPMSSFGLLAVSFAQEVMDRGQANTFSYPMFTLDYLEEGENEAPAPKVNISPVLNLDLKFLLQQMDKLADERQKAVLIEKESELRIQELHHSLETKPGRESTVLQTQSIENTTHRNERNTTRETTHELTRQTVQQLVQQTVEQTVQEFMQQNIQKTAQELTRQSIQKTTQELTQQNIQQTVQQTAQQNIQKTAQELVQQNIQQTVQQTVQQNIQKTTQELMQQNIQKTTQEHTQQTTQEFTRQNIQQTTQELTQQNIQKTTQELMQQSIQQTVQHFVQQNRLELTRQTIQKIAQQTVQQIMTQDMRDFTPQTAQQITVLATRELTQQIIQHTTKQLSLGERESVLRETFVKDSAAAPQHSDREASSRGEEGSMTTAAEKERQTEAADREDAKTPVIHETTVHSERSTLVMQGDHIENKQYHAGDTDVHIELHAENQSRVENNHFVQQGDVYKFSAINSEEATHYHTRRILEKAAEMQQQRLARPGGGMRLLGSEAAAAMAQSIENQQQMPQQVQQPTAESSFTLQAYLGRDGEIYYVQEEDKESSAAAMQQSKGSSEALHSMEREIERFMEATGQERSSISALMEQNEAQVKGVESSAAKPANTKKAETEAGRMLQTVYLPQIQTRKSHRPVGVWSIGTEKRTERMMTPQLEMQLSKVLEAERELGLTYGRSEGGVPSAPQERDAFLKGTTARIVRREQLAEAIAAIPPRTLPLEELEFLQTITERSEASDRLLSAAERVVYRTLQLSDRVWAIPESARETLPPLRRDDVQKRAAEAGANRTGTETSAEAAVKPVAAPSDVAEAEESVPAQIEKVRPADEIAAAMPRNSIPASPTEAGRRETVEHRVILPSETEYLDSAAGKEEAAHDAASLPLSQKTERYTSADRGERPLTAAQTAQTELTSESTLHTLAAEASTETVTEVRRNKAEQKRFFERLIQFIQGGELSPTAPEDERIERKEQQAYKARSAQLEASAQKAEAVLSAAEEQNEISSAIEASAEAEQGARDTSAPLPPIALQQESADKEKRSSAAAGAVLPMTELSYLGETDAETAEVPAKSVASASIAERPSVQTPRSDAGKTPAAVTASAGMTTAVPLNRRIEDDEQLAQSMSELVRLQILEKGGAAAERPSLAARAVYLVRPQAGESAVEYLTRLQSEAGETVYLTETEAGQDRSEAEQTEAKQADMRSTDAAKENMPTAAMPTGGSQASGTETNLMIQTTAAPMSGALHRAIRLALPKPNESAAAYLTRLQTESGEIVYLTAPEAKADAERSGDSVSPGKPKQKMSARTVRPKRGESAAAYLTRLQTELGEIVYLSEDAVKALDAHSSRDEAQPSEKAERKTVRLLSTKAGKDTVAYFTRLETESGDTVYLSAQSETEKETGAPVSAEEAPSRRSPNNAIRLVSIKKGENTVEYLSRFRSESGEIVYLSAQEAEEASARANEREMQTKQEQSKAIHLVAPRRGESAEEYLVRLGTKVGEQAYRSAETGRAPAESLRKPAASSADSGERPILLTRPKQGESAVEYVTRLETESGEIIYLSAPETAERSVPAGESAAPVSRGSGKALLLTKPMSGESAVEYLTRIRRVPGERVYLAAVRTPEALRSIASGRSGSALTDDTVSEIFLPPTEQEYLSASAPELRGEETDEVSRSRTIVIRREEAARASAAHTAQPQAESRDYAEQPVEMSYVAQGGAETPQSFSEPGRIEPPAAPNKQESDFVKSLPDWAKDFLKNGYKESADKSGSISGGTLSAQESEKPNNTITWTNPNTAQYTGPMQPPQELSLKQSKSSDEGTTQTYISDREIRRAADKVYKIIEERLRNERRRRGL